MFIAIIDAHQSARADASTPRLTDDVKTLITAIEATEQVEIVVVSTDSPAVDQAARELGAVNRIDQVHGTDLIARILDSDDTYVDDDAWVLYIESRLADYGFDDAIRRAFTALSVNSTATGLRATGIEGESPLHLFNAGAFKRSGTLPVEGSIDFLAN